VTVATVDGRFRVDHRQDGANDKVPILAEGNRNDRLDIGFVFHRVGRADAEVEVVLNRDADEIGDGVLKFLGQFGLLIFFLATAGGRCFGGR
jgi:hypothetical protein